jgi:hypothetical protein
VAGSLSGTYAEFALCLEAQTHALPDSIAFEQGAAVGIPYATAYRALFQKANATLGETVLIHGASGGVGVAATQLARASHRIRWFWTAHVPHHSGQVMNFTTAMRQSLLNAFVGIWVFYLPPVLLGVPPAVVMFMLAVDLVYQYFVHTESIGRLPRWYEYGFDTPSNHRGHHGRNPQYIDRNYGGVLILFDRWFGTYEPEIEPVEYGIVRQVQSHNVLVLNVHEFVDMVRDALAPGPLWQRLKHLWKPPEWERAGHAPVHTWTTELKTPVRPE